MLADDAADDLRPWVPAGLQAAREDAEDLERARAALLDHANGRGRDMFEVLAEVDAELA